MLHGTPIDRRVAARSDETEAPRPLARIGVFADLPPEVVSRLERGAMPLEPSSGSELFAQGDPADSVYAVAGGEGLVRVGAASEVRAGAVERHPKRLMVEIFRAGDIFGEMAALDPAPRSATAVTDGRVRLMRISSAVFMGVLNDTPALGVNIARLLAHRLRRTFSLFQDATFERLEVLLARQVLYLAELHGRRAAQGVVLGSRLRQSDLADLLGATPRSIITILNSWRADGLVQYDTTRAQLTILNQERLRELIRSSRDSV